MENLGILLALGAAIAWGTYIVPFKLSKSQNLLQFQAYMGLGILLSGIVISLLVGYPLNLNHWGILSGVLWAVANLFSLSSINNLGMSKAIPIISSLVILSTFLWGVLIFNELPQGWVTASIGVGLIILGVVTVSSLKTDKVSGSRVGLIYAVLAGLIFGSQLVPIKIGNVTSSQFFFSTCLGIFITALLTFFIKKGVKFTKEAIFSSIITGSIWNIVNLLSIIAISILGLAKGMPIAQSATLIAVLWGLFYFKEITKRRDKIQVLIGTIILLFGIIILASA